LGIIEKNMDQINEIVQFTRASIDKISELDDFIDKSLQPLKDYSDTIGDLVKPIKTIISIVSLHRKIALKAFVKNYARCLTENYKLDDREIEKLKKYFNKPQNLHFISETIDNGIQSKSVKCSAILGVIAGLMIKLKREIDESDLVVIDSLKEMNDFDLSNFIELVENIRSVYAEDLWSKKTYFETEFRTKDIYGTEGWKPIKMDRISLELTIEKLKRTGALSYGEGGIGSLGNAKGAFMFTELTKRIYELIKQTKIE
jgi:hypothetical protein